MYTYVFMKNKLCCKHTYVDVAGSRKEALEKKGQLLKIARSNAELTAGEDV